MERHRCPARYPSDPSEVERVARKYLKKGFYLFDAELNNLVPKTCFAEVRRKDSYIILVSPPTEVKTLHFRSAKRIKEN